MTEKILIFSDNLHGKNKLYYKTKDNIYYVHYDILDEIVKKYPEKNNFYIYGEAIDKEYNITYNKKQFTISGEEVNINSIWIKLLNGFSGIIFGCNPFVPESCESVKTIFNRIKEILDSIPDKSNVIYDRYMQLFELIESNLIETQRLHEDYKDFLEKNKGKDVEIAEKYRQVTESIKKNNNLDSKFSIYVQILEILKENKENKEIIRLLDMIISNINSLSHKPLYDITLYIRDTNIVSDILRTKSEMIIIIIGGNHVGNIERLLKQHPDNLIIKTIEKNDKLVENIETLEGGDYYDKYMKYKLKYINLKKYIKN